MTGAIGSQIGSNAAVVVKSDTTMLTNVLGLYIGGAGDVAVMPAAQESAETPTPVTFKAVPVGTFLPIQASRVMSTNTTATLIVAVLSY